LSTICGVHQHCGLAKHGAVAAADSGELHRQLLEAAEAARGLGQVVLMCARGGHGLHVERLDAGDGLVEDAHGIGLLLSTR
jgi:hypothetical protein